MIIFLDTNILIDYIENRDRDVAHFVQNILDGDKHNLATSIYNIIELLDKIQEIRHMGKLVLRKLSFDEIALQRRKKKLNSGERGDILEEIAKLKEKMIIYQIDKSEGYQKVIDLLAEINMGSQDALIVGAYATSEANMFISKDSELITSIKSKIEAVYDIKKDNNEIKRILELK